MLKVMAFINKENNYRVGVYNGDKLFMEYDHNFTDYETADYAAKRYAEEENYEYVSNR